MSDDLVQFLRARLDEDEAAAREVVATFGASWLVDDAMDSVRSDTGADVVAEPGTPRGHIARHDPARVLAEVEAKRMVLDSIVPTMNAFEGKIDQEWGTGEGEHASAAFLRAWARAYRDHPDFNPAWLED